MPVPALNEDGFLPPGIHDCTLDEIRGRFGAFQSIDRRPRLFATLLAFVAEARASGIVVALVINGSFTTGKPDPNDIDLVVVLRRAGRFVADMPPSQYNVISKRRVRRRHGFDILLARQGTEEEDDAVGFYQQIRGRSTQRKGVLRIWL